MLAIYQIEITITTTTQKTTPLLTLLPQSPLIIPRERFYYLHIPQGMQVIAQTDKPTE